MAQGLKGFLKAAFLTGAAGVALTGCAGIDKDLVLPQTPQHPAWISDTPWADTADYRREMDSIHFFHNTDVQAARAEATAAKYSCKSEFEASAKDAAAEDHKLACLSIADGDLLRKVNIADRAEMRDWIRTDRRYRDDFHEHTGQYTGAPAAPMSESDFKDELKIRCQKGLMSAAEGASTMSPSQLGICHDLLPLLSSKAEAPAASASSSSSSSSQGGSSPGVIVVQVPAAVPYPQPVAPAPAQQPLPPPVPVQSAPPAAPAAQPAPPRPPTPVGTASFPLLP